MLGEGIARQGSGELGKIRHPHGHYMRCRMHEGGFLLASRGLELSAEYGESMPCVL